jgi:hypothetical protein
MRVRLSTLLLVLIVALTAFADDNFITVEQGSAQSTYVNSQFSTTLQLVVETSQQLPARVQVTLTAPASGASALFNSATGSYTYVALTDSDGRISVDVWANSVVGTYTITARAPGATPVLITLYNNGNPATVSVVSGSGQSAVVNTLFANRLRGRLTDASNKPSVFVKVVLTAQNVLEATGAFVGSQQGQPNRIEVFTDTNGYFEASIQAGTVIGSYTATSSVPDNLSASTGTWSLTNTYAAGNAITARSGQNQVTTVSTNFRAALVVFVGDQFGNPVPDIAVTFLIPRDTAAFASFNGAADPKTTTVITGIDGLATSPLMAANSVSGGYTATASAVLGGSTKTATFALYNNPNYATLTYTLISPKTQITTTANQVFDEALVVQVTDPGLNPVPNVTISFQAPTDPLAATCLWGASNSYIGVTNGTGHVVAPAPLASKIKGNFAVNYNPISPTKDPFSLLVNPDVPATIKPVYTSSPTIVNRNFENPLRAEVLDQFGNGVPDTPVWFYQETDFESCLEAETPESQLTTVPSILFDTVRCSKNVVGNSQGIVVSSSPLRLNLVAGTYRVIAVVASNSDVNTSFTLINLPDKAVSIAIFNETERSAKVGTYYVPLGVQAFDEHGNLVPGVTVNFWAPTSPATVVLGQSSVVTGTGTGASGPLGLAQTSALASERPGSFEVKANSTGIANEVVFLLENVVNDPALLYFRSSSAAQTVVDKFFANSFVVLVTDIYNNPVEGVIVTFEAPNTVGLPGGEFIGDSFRVTNASGLVELYGNQDFKANVVTGEYLLTASFTDVALPISFTLTNTPDVPDHFDVVYPVPVTQPSAAVVTQIHTPTIRLYVRDQFENVIPDQQVLFELTPGSDLGAGIPSGLFLESNSTVYTPKTNGTGYASARQIRANQFAGRFTVHASVPGYDEPLLNHDFSFDNLPAKPHVIVSNYDDSAASAIVADYFDDLTLTVYDEYGNTVLDDVFVQLTIGTSETDPEATAHFFDGNTKTSTIELQTNEDGDVVNIPDILANQVSGTYTLTIGARAGETTSASELLELTNIPGPVTAVLFVSGIEQYVKVTEEYQVMVVQVFDQYNNTVYDQPVMFEVVVLGTAGAAFDGSSTYETRSDGQGFAASGVLTANQRAGDFQVRVYADDTRETIVQYNIPNDPSYFEIDEANPRSTTVNQEFDDAIALTVFDFYGNYIPNTPVRFTSPASGASLYFNGDKTNYTVVTDGDGFISTDTLLATTKAGNYIVAISCPGYDAYEEIGFTNVHDDAYKLALTSSDYVVIARTSEVASPVEVLVLDFFDNPVPEISVTFTVVPNPDNSAGGSFSSSPTATGESDDDGIALSSVQFTANSVAGLYKITASSTGLESLDLPAANANNVPALISLSTPDQIVQAGEIVADPLFVVVLDEGNNPAYLYRVTFSTPTTGPSCLFDNKHTADVTIDTEGTAQAPPCRANGVLGAFNVTAVAYGGLSVDLGVTVVVGNASNIVVVSGDQQSAEVTKTFNPVEVLVTDSFNNIVVGTAVTFSVAASGASAVFDASSTSVTLPTGANGKVSTSAHTLRANTVAGTWSLSVLVQGIVSPKLVTFTNTPAAASKLTLVSGGGQNTTVATVFGRGIVILAQDQYNNAVPGSAVTLTAPASGASLTFSNGQNTITGSTASDGTYSSSAPTALTVAGTFTVSVSGAQTLTFSMTNNPGAVAQFTRQNAASRSATVNTAYSEAFKVLAADRYGNPRSGVSVQFFAPVVGAAGSFTGSTSSSSATTDASGIATSSTFTANTVAGEFSVTVNATSVQTSLSFECTNEAGAAAHIDVNSGNSQSVKPAATMSALAVVVTDQYSNAVAGATVTFTAPITGSRLTFAGSNVASGTTDSDGIVSTVSPVAGTVAGSFSVTAESGALSTQFSLNIVPDSPASLAVTSGNGQSAVVNTEFDSPLAVTVTDQYNNVIAGVPVTFGTPASGPSATFDGNNTAWSDALGVATSSSLTASTTAGSFVVTASASGVGSVNIQLANTPAAPSQVTVYGNPTTSAVVENNFSELSVVVKDQYDNPVSEVQVTFTAPASGPSGVFNQSGLRQVSAVTGSNGVATSPLFVANTVSGSYSVNATVAGVANTASFTLTNQPGAAFAVSISSGDAQSTSTGSQFSQPLNVLVKDKHNNPVSGASVVFTIRGDSGSAFTSGLTTATVLTALTGRASSPLITAGTEAGSFNVVANVTSVGSVTFSLTIVEPPVAAPVQEPASEAPVAPVGSTPTAAPVSTPADAGVVSASTAVAINSVAVVLASVFYLCF